MHCELLYRIALPRANRAHDIFQTEQRLPTLVGVSKPLRVVDDGRKPEQDLALLALQKRLVWSKCNDTHFVRRLTNTEIPNLVCCQRGSNKVALGEVTIEISSLVIK